MATFNKPEFNSVWATSGAKVAPDVAKISLGWVVEIPPHEMDNWIRNRQDAMLAHINQAGVVYWDETVEYQANKSYVQGRTTGNVYRAITTHTGVNPETDVNNNWQIAFEAGGSALLKAQNLADVPDKALARQNLGISTTSDYDGRYLRRSQNLADVPNKATGRANLGLGNSSTRNIGTTVGTVAAGDDDRIVNAVQKSTSISAGNGLLGGGVLSSSRTISLGVPSSITATSGNTVSPGTHTHSIDLDSIISCNPSGVSFSNGLKIITGRVTTGTSSTGGDIITFPTPFNNACICVWITSVASTTNGAEYAQVTSWDRTKVQGVTYTDVSERRVGTLTFTYAAIGY